MVRSGDRSDKIRTYNYPQGRVTDHRIKYTSYNLSGVLNGALNPFVERLHTTAQAEQLTGGRGQPRAYCLLTETMPRRGGRLFAFFIPKPLPHTTMRRKYAPSFFILCLLAVGACRLEPEMADAVGTHSFYCSTDTLRFDTIFSEAQGYTRRFYVRNRLSRAIRLKSLCLWKRERRPIFVST